MTLRGWIPWLALVGATGCALPAESVGAAASAVRSGTEDDADPAVVAVYIEETVLCSGTLVSPRVVVTAAHCLDPSYLGTHAISDIEVRFGKKLFSPDFIVNVVEGVSHPSYDIQQPFDSDAPDVAVLRLGAPVDVAPVDLPDDAATKALVYGAPLRVVGFGITAYGLEDYGTKRQATTKVNSLIEWSVKPSPALMCSGDSGGPYLLEAGGREVLAAVHSNGNCFSDNIGYRVDVLMSDFVLPFVEADCIEDGVCTRACRTVIDPDCACAEDGECTDACANASKDPDCVDHCEEDGVCVEDCGGGEDPDCGPPAASPASDETSSGCDIGAPRAGLRWVDCAWLGSLLALSLGVARGRR